MNFPIIKLDLFDWQIFKKSGPHAIRLTLNLPVFQIYLFCVLCHQKVVYRATLIVFIIRSKPSIFSYRVIWIWWQRVLNIEITWISRGSRQLNWRSCDNSRKRLMKSYRDVDVKFICTQQISKMRQYRYLFWWVRNCLWL